MGALFPDNFDCFFGRFHVKKAALGIAICYVFMLIVLWITYCVTWLHEQSSQQKRAQRLFELLAELISDVEQPEEPQREFNIFDDTENVFLPKKVYLISLLSVAVVSFAVVMIYGIVKEIRCCLLPFFCWQIFDLIISSACIVIYFWYLQAINQSRTMGEMYPEIVKLFDLSNKKFVLFTIVTILSIIFLKIYSVCIVWRCFKYLTEISDIKSLPSSRFVVHRGRRQQPPPLPPKDFQKVVLPKKLICKPISVADGDGAEVDVDIDVDVEKDNISMLNDSDTTIFINEKYIKK